MNVVWLAVKLKYHAAEAGGVRKVVTSACSCEVEVPPAEAGGVRKVVTSVCSCEIEVPPASAGGVGVCYRSCTGSIAINRAVGSKVILNGRSARRPRITGVEEGTPINT